MSDSRVRSSLPERLTSRRGAWVSLTLVLLAIVALFGMLSGAEAPAGVSASPANSESAQVKALADQFAGSDEGSVLIVATRDDGGALTDADMAALTAQVPGIDAVTGHEASARSRARTARRPSSRPRSRSARTTRRPPRP